MEYWSSTVLWGAAVLIERLSNGGARAAIERIGELYLSQGEPAPTDLAPVLNTLAQFFEREHSADGTIYELYCYRSSEGAMVLWIAFSIVPHAQRARFYLVAVDPQQPALLRGRALVALQSFIYEYVENHPKYDFACVATHRSEPLIQKMLPDLFPVSVQMDQYMRFGDEYRPAYFHYRPRSASD